MSDITAIPMDEATGLPKLPEDHVWYVESSDDTSVAGVYIIRNETSTVTEFPGERWPRREFIGDEPNAHHRWFTGNDEKVYEDVQVPVKFLGITWGYRTEQKLERTIREVKAPVAAHRDTFLNFEWTPENVREAAFEVYEDWQEELREKEEREAARKIIDNLSGLYPPNKLVESE